MSLNGGRVPVHDGGMNTIMDDSQIETMEQVRRFLTGSTAMGMAISSKAESRPRIAAGVSSGGQRILSSPDHSDGWPIPRDGKGRTAILHLYNPRHSASYLRDRRQITKTRSTLRRQGNTAGDGLGEHSGGRPILGSRAREAQITLPTVAHTTRANCYRTL